MLCALYEQTLWTAKLYLHGLALAGGVEDSEVAKIATLSVRFSLSEHAEDGGGVRPEYLACTPSLRLSTSTKHHHTRVFARTGELLHDLELKVQQIAPFVPNTPRFQFTFAMQARSPDTLAWLERG